jgi:hypothetical protein
LGCWEEIVRKIAILAVPLALAGCSFCGTVVTEPPAGQFEMGITPRYQVTAELGVPNSTTLINDGTEIDIYDHVHAVANGAAFVSAAGLPASGASGDGASFTYDKRGILKTVSTSTGQALPAAGPPTRK